METPVYDRRSLAPGSEISGPAIIEQMDTTTVVEIGVKAFMDTCGNLILRIDRG